MAIVTTVEPLTYLGKPLSMEPVNAPIEVLRELVSPANDLVYGEPDAGRSPTSVIAVLEPGDTRVYRILIVPLIIAGSSGEMRYAGVSADEADAYALVGVLPVGSGHVDLVRIDREVSPWDLSHCVNMSERRIVARFLNLLFGHVEERTS